MAGKVERGGVGVDGDEADILLTQLAASGVGSLDAGAEGDVVSGVFQLPDDGGGTVAKFRTRESVGRRSRVRGEAVLHTGGGFRWLL